MSSTEIDTMIEITLAATGNYADKAQALQKDLSASAQGDDYALLGTVIQQYIQEAGKLEANLKGVLAKLVELESKQTRREQYGERWWQQKRQALYKAFEMDPQDGLSQWLQVYVGALIDWELGICEKLVSESFAFPLQEIDFTRLFQNGTKATVDEKYTQALDMLTYLVQATSGKLSRPILNESTRATLLIFVGRIYLYKVPDGEVALKYFEQAKELAPKDGRPYAALGEYYRLKKDRDKASACYQQAIELSPKQPDGYVSMGLLMEDQSLWDEADDRYEEAIEAVREEKDIQVALSKLLAPTSGNLYLQLARMLKKKAPEQALQAVDLAISLGIKHDGKYPERLGYRLQGEILESLERQVEAAAAYYEAGQRFGWRNEYKIGIELLTQANELDPNNISIYWVLSDYLRYSSYKTPFPDEDLIRMSRDVWERGYAKAKAKSADTDYALAYVVRSLINEPQARLPDVDRWTLYWEASAYLEQSILLNEEDAQHWSLLAQFHRLLDLDRNALQDTSNALDHDSENLNALDERAANLSNLGEFDAAEEVIERRQKLEPNQWLDAVKAYILIRKSSYGEALEILQSVLQTSPEEIGYRDLRANCYLMLDKLVPAKEDYEWIYKWILEEYKLSDAGNLDTFAWAAYTLAQLTTDSESFSNYIDKAIEILSMLCKKPIGSGNTYRWLGLSYLVRGDLVLGEENLGEGIKRAKNTRELDDVLKLDFYTIEKFCDNWPHSIQVREALGRIKEKVRTRKIQIEQGHSAEEELKEVVEKYPFEEGKINWAGIGAHAGLGRLYIEEKRWREAATTYLILQKEGERFSEAHLSLAKCFDGLQAEGDACMRAGEPREALEWLLQISKLELLLDDKTRQAQLYSRLGYVYFDLEDIENARKHFAKALQLYRENGSSSPGSALSEVCQALLRNATQYWALNALWKVMAEEQGIDEILRNELIIARKSLANYLDVLYKLSEQFEDRTKFLPVVTPIVLEIGDGLIPADTSQEWSLFKFYIPEMRQRFQNKMGVKVPGIRVLGSNILSLADYLIKLDEVEIERDTVYLNMRYCPAPPETIQALGVPKTVLIEKPHPMTGEPGCWIPQDSWELILSNNLELWAEPLVYIIRQLEAVILRNLTNFMGTQDVKDLLAEWGKNQDASALIASALPGERAQYYFAQVLRALVREQVPITSWKDILEAFQESGSVNGDVSQAVRIVRLRLKKQLPGNNPNVQRLELPIEWEDMLISGLEHKNGRTFLTLPPDKTHEFLLTIRNALKASDWNLVLVTQSSEIRPFVRRLVENEFPHLMVLSQDELIPVDQVVGMEQAKGGATDAQ